MNWKRSSSRCCYVETTQPPPPDSQSYCAFVNCAFVLGEGFLRRSFRAHLVSSNFLVFSLLHPFSDYHCTPIIFRFAYEDENQGRSEMDEGVKLSKSNIWLNVLEMTNLPIKVLLKNKRVTKLFRWRWVHFFIVLDFALYFNPILWTSYLLADFNIQI